MTIIKQIKGNLKQIKNSENSIEDENISKYKSELQEYLSKNSHCEDISIPLFHSFLQPIPPIFIDVNVKMKQWD